MSRRRSRGLGVLGALLAAAGLAAAAAAQPPAQPPRPRQSPIPVADSARASRQDSAPAPPAGASARSPLARQAARDSARRTAGDSVRATPPRATPAARPDSAPAADSGDSTPRELVQWVEPDSVMAALLQRSGYVVTRYQGDSAAFLTAPSRIVLFGEPAAVQQGEALAVGQRIQYNDERDSIIVSGDPGRPVVLRDPTYGEDVIAEGEIRYDLNTRQGVVTNVSTAVESGERWYVGAERAALAGARPGAQSALRFYGHDGSITSCDLTVPHYHFEARNLKVVRGSLMVARPAILYIGNVPVMWLPFVFQDMREGRRSGILSPRFGVAELIRNSPFYRRSIENLGYYFALSDYTDASVWVDWRSSARSTDFDPGLLRYNGEFRYRWENRFLSGNLGAGYETYGDGRRNLQLTWQHQQSFSQRTSFSANVNYAQSTQLQRLSAIQPLAALATIRSNTNFQTRRGPFALSLGATQTQYTGQERVDRSFPTLNLTSEPISVGEWLTWTPSLNATNSENLNNPLLGELGTRPRRDPVTGGVVIDTTRFDRRSTSVTLNTPLQIFGFNWANTITVQDDESDAPVRATIYNSTTPGDSTVRVFAREFRTSVDWNTSVGLPQLFGGTWNLTPTVGIQNVAPGAFLVRSFLSGGDYVQQRKRLTFGLSTSPTLYRRFPGFGPFEALRHSIQPGLSWQYAPAARVDDEYLQAVGQNPATYVGSLASNTLGLTFSTVLEAKLRGRGDSTERGDAGQGATSDKVRLVALDFSGLNYDFIRADTLGRGLTNETFSISGRSDLLPGFDFRMQYSLFNGPSADIRSEFKPYLTEIGASFSLGRNSNALALLSRIFGLGRPQEEPGIERLQPTADDTLARQLGELPVAGSRARMPVQQIPTGQGWRASFNFSTRRTRPDLLGTVVDFDPATECEAFRNEPVSFQRCIDYQQRNPPAPDAVPSTGGIIVRTPPVTSLSSALTFDLTRKWAASWNTSYDFERGEFASHQVSLQRDLHDWRAVFAFTQAPNGNFAFNFFIALKPLPDLKFDFNRQNYRGPAIR